MSNLLRRMAPAVFVGTAAVLVVSNASNGAPVAADATSAPTDATATPQQRGDGFRLFGGDDDHEREWFGHDEDDDHEDDEYEDDEYEDDGYAPPVQPQPAPAPNSAGSTTGGTVSGGQGTGTCTAAEVTGPVARTEWGPVQVAAKVQNGRVCSVRTIQYPDGDRKSVSINARALPAIEQQVLAVGDASFDGVSGATVTTEGYRDSLQAILDQAR